MEPPDRLVLQLGEGRLAADVRGAARRFPVEGDVVTALDRVDLDIAVGRMTVVAGPSGSGKSTLLSLLACTQRPDEGSVMIGDTDVLALSRRGRREMRRDRLGIVLPQPSENLLDQLDAAANVHWSALQRRARSAGDQAVDAAGDVDRLLDRVGLAAGSARAAYASSPAASNNASQLPVRSPVVRNWSSSTSRPPRSTGSTPPR